MAREERGEGRVGEGREEKGKGRKGEEKGERVASWLLGGWTPLLTVTKGPQIWPPILS